MGAHVGGDTVTYDPHQDSHEEQSNLLGAMADSFTRHPVLWGLAVAAFLTLGCVGGSWLWSLYGSGR